MGVLKWFLLLLLVTFAAHCKKADATYGVKQIQSGEVFVDSLNVWTNELSNLNVNSYNSKDSVIQLNGKIRSLIENITSHSLLQKIEISYKSGKQNFFFTISEDKKFAVFSWNSLTKLSVSGYRNIALYIHNNKIIPTSLYDNSAVYNQIYTLKSKRGHTVYILHGKGRSKDSNNYYRIDAYSIRKGGLNLEKIFPDRMESIVLVNQNEDFLSDLSPNFEVLKEGTYIKIPQRQDSTVVYSPIEFDGKRYNAIDLN